MLGVAKDGHGDETTVDGRAPYESQNYQYVAQGVQYDLGDEFMNLGIKTHNDANFGSRKTQSYYPDDPLLESHVLFTKTLECLDVDEPVQYSPGPKTGLIHLAGRTPRPYRSLGNECTAMLIIPVARTPIRACLHGDAPEPVV